MIPAENKQLAEHKHGVFARLFSIETLLPELGL